MRRLATPLVLLLCLPVVGADVRHRQSGFWGLQGDVHTVATDYFECGTGKCVSKGRDEITFDTEGRKIEETFINPDGKVRDRQQVRYEGRRVVEETSFDGATGRTTVRTMRWDEHGHMRESDTFVDGVLTTHISEGPASTAEGPRWESHTTRSNGTTSERQEVHRREGKESVTEEIVDGQLTERISGHVDDEGDDAVVINMPDGSYTRHRHHPDGSSEAEDYSAPVQTLTVTKTDTNDRPVEVLTNQNGKQTRQTRTYDQRGNLLQWDQFDEQGRLSLRQKSTYTFDAHGSWTLHREFECVQCYLHPAMRLANEERRAITYY